MKNYYNILGVTPDSSLEDIKIAFRRLARKYHPDVNKDGTKRFIDISEAYETLSDAKKRLQYDTINGFFKSSSREKSEKKRTSSKQAQNEYKKRAGSKNFTEPEFSKKEFSKKINDMFEEFTKSKKEENSARKGDDIYEEISITMREAVNGAVRLINIMHSGECPNCKGRKFINGSVCRVCKGSGEKIEHKKISVKIPKNIKNGAKLRLAGEGGCGINGGKNGDLYIKIKIQPNNRIKFDGNDIIYSVPVSPFEAVLGGSISIPVFEGNVNLKLPPMTHSGQKFRLAGQGLSQNNKSGDMIVIVHIEIPCSLSDDEIKLYEKLKKLSLNSIRENLLNE